MKPTLAAMETKCNMADASGTPRQQSDQASGHSKVMTGVAIAVVSMVIISAIVVGAVFLGGHLAREAQKESWVRVNTEDGQSVRERITVGQDEEEMLIPGQYQALFDFKRSVFFLKDLTDVEGKCYMSTFNKTIIPSPAELRPLMDTDQIQSIVDGPVATVYLTPTSTQIQSIFDVPIATVYLTPTSAQVSTDVLSPAAQSMCRVVFWALSTEDCHGGPLRVKRFSNANRCSVDPCSRIKKRPTREVIKCKKRRSMISVSPCINIGFVNIVVGSNDGE